MAKLVFGMNQSLDGYVDHHEFQPDPTLFRHWIEHVRGLAGSVYGRRMWDIMRYWDADDPEWDAGRARLRRGVAQPAEMGCIALIEVRRPQRHAGPGRP